MTTLLAALPLLVASQGWTVLPLPVPSRLRNHVEVQQPAPEGRHLHFNEWRNDPSVDESAEIPAPMIVQWLQEEARRRGSQLTVAPNAPPLLVTGTEEDLNWARDLIRGLDAIGHTLEVEVEAWLVPQLVDGDPGPEALGALAGVRHFGGTLHSGDSTLFGEPKRLAFVADYDVEVATDSGVAAPVIGQAVTGEQLYLSVQRVDGGRAVQVFGVIDLAELEGIEEFEPGTPDLGGTQQPIIDFAQVTFSGRVVPGEALRVSLASSGVGDENGGDWTLFVRASTTPDANSAPMVGWRALDLALLAGETPELSPVSAGTSLSHDAKLHALSGTRSSMPPAGVLALLGRERRRDVQRPPVQWTDQLLLVHADDPARFEELSALVAGLESASAQQTMCKLEQGPLIVEFPMSEGVPARVLVGTERTLLIDYDAEIAPNTWMPAPRSEALLDGLAWQGLVQGETLVGECFRAATSAITVRERRASSLGAVQLPERSHASANGQLRAGMRRVWLPASSTTEPLIVSRGTL